MYEYSSYLRFSPGSRVSSIDDGESDIGNREPSSDSSSLAPSQASTTDNDEPDHGPNRESSNEPSSDTSSQTLVSQTIANLSPSRSRSPNVHHTDQDNGPGHQGDGSLTSSIDQPKSQRSGSGVPPNDSTTQNLQTARNPQTASSVINQMHAVIDQTTLTLTSTATGLHQILLSSRDQLESTRTALTQTLQDFMESNETRPYINMTKRLIEQSNNLQQQINRIDTRHESLETTLGQAHPIISTQVFTHRANTDDHDSNSPADDDHDSNSSTTSTLL